jgi:hypothetical protein
MIDPGADGQRKGKWKVFNESAWARQVFSRQDDSARPVAWAFGGRMDADVSCTKEEDLRGDTWPWRAGEAEHIYCWSLGWLCKAVVEIRECDDAWTTTGWLISD